MVSQSNAAAYAAANPTITTFLPNGKLRFDASGMEFPQNVSMATLNAYRNGGYKRTLQRQKDGEYDFDVHLPYIVPHPHRDERNFLLCKLTNSTLPRMWQVVKRHSETKRFQRLKDEADKKAKIRERALEKRKQRRAMAQRDTSDDDITQRTSEIISDNSEDWDSDEEVKKFAEKTERAGLNEPLLKTPRKPRRLSGIRKREHSKGLIVKSPAARLAQEEKAHKDEDKMNTDEPENDKDAGKVTGKRTVKAMIPKKVRQARQRRKSNPTS